MINARNICEEFKIEGRVVSISPYGNGHINDTYLVITDVSGSEKKYILQRINKNVFKQPDLLMANMAAVTKYLSGKISEANGDPMRETLNIIKTTKNDDCFVDAEGEYWRMLVYVVDNKCYDRVETPEQFYLSAVAFGNFQYMLKDFPADTLHETIKDFHNTPDRFRKFTEAVKGDVKGRLSSVLSEVEFVKQREAFCHTLENAHAEGKLPLKVTHNDTKLNNILFDAKNGKALCIIDLDTIMPGYSVNDFGDSIRFGATTAAEDEADLSLVNFDIELYEMYVKGFIEGAKGGLTDGELELLPIGAIMMTLEVGMRFLTDYLEGDTYFKISREHHNLDRARNQFKLVADMESKLDLMNKIVEKYSVK